MDFTSKPTPEQQKAYEEKLRRGPSGLIIYTAEGSEAMSSQQLDLVSVPHGFRHGRADHGARRLASRTSGHGEDRNAAR
jgi:hypothetical protein